MHDDIYIAWKAADLSRDVFMMLCEQAYERIIAKHTGDYDRSDMIRRVMFTPVGDDKDGMHIRVLRTDELLKGRYTQERVKND